MQPVIDRSMPVRTPSWMRMETFLAPPAALVSLARGVSVARPLIRRASELEDAELTPPPPPREPFEPPDWYAQAACHTVDREVFFSEDRAKRVTLANQAKKLCRRCPMAQECLTGALGRREEFGIWAATSGLRRKQMLARIDSGLSTVEDEVELWLNGR